MKQLIKQGVITAADWFGPHRRGNFKNTPKLWVLMYHRILPREDLRYALEEPGMIVQPDTFAMHLREVKKHFDVLDLNDWLTLKMAGETLPERACVITFDDGWYDNYEFALPIIKQEKVPITLFAVVEKIATDFQFWPNLISALLSSNAIAAIRQHPLFAKALDGIVQSNAAIDREVVARAIKSLKQFSDAEIFAALETINWRNLLAFDLPRGLMNWTELEAMQASGLVKIGSHTCNHKRLNAALPANELVHEIIASKNQLQKQLPETVNIFCFPNGDYNSAAMQLVEQNYHAAVTTARGIVDAHSTPLHQLCRIGLHEQISNSPQLLGARLSGWR